MSRLPIRNGVLQSDLDAAGFRIINLPTGGSSSVVSGTAYVDPSAEPGTGKIDTSEPFSTLEAALAAAPPGYSIIMRPATYRWDGTVTVSRAGIKIFGYGAVIKPATTGMAARLGITASDVTIFGLEMDNEADVGVTDVDDGAITIVGGIRTQLVDLSIHNQDGVAIKLDTRFPGTMIDNCRIQSCHRGITSAVNGIANSNLTINNCTIQSNRADGIYLVGDANVTVQNDYRITGNRITGNGTVAGISIQGASDIIIANNYFADQGDGIILTKVRRTRVIGNEFSNHNRYAINVAGHINLNIEGNTISGTNPANNNPTTTRGVLIDGDYATANDSGPAIINGNIITGITSSGYAIEVAHANDVSIQANRMTGLSGIYIRAMVRASVIANAITLTSNSSLISINADDRLTTGITIAGNELLTTGTPGRLIATSDAGGLGMSNLRIVGNGSSVGKTYANGIVGNAAGTAPTEVHISANVPKSATANSTTGWVNDEIVVAGKVFVSQSRGINATALPYRRDHPYLTIAGAINNAVSGDTVIVLDGTFDERLSGKAGITVRFEPPAKLVSTTAGGCIQTSAANAAFTVYHEHTPIVATEAASYGILCNHVGAFITLHGSITHTGASSAYAIGGPNGAVEVFGSVYSQNSPAIFNTGAGTFVGIVHGEYNSLPTVRSDAAAAIDIANGSVKVINGTIVGATAGVTIRAGAAQHVYKNCTIYGNNTAAPAVSFATFGSLLPIFYNCVLKSGSTATESIAAGSAQSVNLYGANVANKGPNPPTNVTFVGGGTYAVDAAVIGEF